MVHIPLAIGALSRDPSFTQPVILRNLVVEKDESGDAQETVLRIQRPGCAPYQTVATGSLVRGLFYTDRILGSLPVAAIGSSLYSFNGTTATNLGSIGDDGNLVDFAATNFGIAVVSNGALYFYDTSMHTIPLPGGAIPVAVSSINSYLIVATATGQWYWVVPGALTIASLNFATAEFSPDSLVALFTLTDEVWMFGTNSIEVWQPTGDSTLILGRASGRTMGAGCMARDTVCAVDNNVMWVGNDGIVYKGGGVPQRVSDTGIEEQIRKRTGLPTAFNFTFDGHQFYVLNIPGVSTFAFDVLTDRWSEFTTLGGTSGWLPRTACSIGSTVLVGDSTSGNVFKLDPTVNRDNGTVFERAISGAVPFSGGRRRNDSIEVDIGCSANVVLRLRWHDGLDSGWSAYRTETGNAPSDVVRYTRLGAARQPYRAIELSTISDVQVRISGARANEGRAV